MSPTFASVSDLSDRNVQNAHSDEDLKVIITKGFKRMPPVRNLSDPELDALITQVRILGGAEPAKAPALEEEAPADGSPADGSPADDAAGEQAPSDDAANDDAPAEKDADQ